MVSVSTVQPSINLELLCNNKNLKMSLYTLFWKTESTDFHIWKVMHKIIAERWKNPCRHHNIFWDDSFGQLLMLLLFCFLSEYVLCPFGSNDLASSSFCLAAYCAKVQPGPVLFIWALKCFYPIGDPRNL